MGHVPHGPEHDADGAARDADEALTRRRIAALVAFNAAAILIVIGLCALAAWQVQRRAWKLDLIAQVEARVHAAPVAAPQRAQWPDVMAAQDQYRRVSVAGTWTGVRSALVQAATELGGGFWVLSPLARDDGTIVFVNRGFIPAEQRDAQSWEVRAGEPAEVTGLLRVTEPGGAFLRSNDPAADRWFSRDIAAMAASRGLTNVAPFFIDAQRAPGTAELPVPGLTVIRFSNNHLVYALTWGGLALMAAAGAAYVNIDVRRRHRRGRNEAGDTNVRS